MTYKSISLMIITFSSLLLFSPHSVFNTQNQLIAEENNTQESENPVTTQEGENPVTTQEGENPVTTQEGENPVTTQEDRETYCNEKYPGTSSLGLTIYVNKQDADPEILALANSLLALYDQANISNKNEMQLAEEQGNSLSHGSNSPEFIEAQNKTLEADSKSESIQKQISEAQNALLSKVAEKTQACIDSN